MCSFSFAFKSVRISIVNYNFYVHFNHKYNLVNTCKSDLEIGFFFDSRKSSFWSRNEILIHVFLFDSRLFLPYTTIFTSILISVYLSSVDVPLLILFLCVFHHCILGELIIIITIIIQCKFNGDAEDSQWILG